MSSRLRNPGSNLAGVDNGFAALVDNFGGKHPWLPRPYQYSVEGAPRIHHAGLAEPAAD